MLVTASPAPTVSYCLTSESVQVGRAREQARNALPGLGLADYAELAELIVSELVTNALVHGNGQIEVHLSYARGSLRAAVHDCGAGRPVRQHPAADSESGRGLELIDGLIEPYGGTRGVVDDGDCRGKTVYVAVALAPDPKGIQ
jgi:anti-sigma regulatory factor (Ser/Thr protein kinase)